MAGDDMLVTWKDFAIYTVPGGQAFVLLPYYHQIWWGLVVSGNSCTMFKIDSSEASFA